MPKVKRPPSHPGALPTMAPEFVAGQQVRARWRNGRFYSATYLTISIKAGRHHVMFNDGVRYLSRDVRPTKRG